MTTDDSSTIAKKPNPLYKAAKIEIGGITLQVISQTIAMGLWESHEVFTANEARAIAITLNGMADAIDAQEGDES